MKKVLFAALAWCAVMIGCSSEDNSIPAGGGNEESEKIAVVVKLPDNVVLRSVEGPVNTGGYTIIQEDDTKYKTIVFLLNGNTVVTSHDFEKEEIKNGKRIEQVPSTVNGVLVLANLPVDEVAEVKKLKSTGEIEKYNYALKSQQNEGINDKLLKGKSSTPVSDPTIVGTADDHDYKEYKVKLESITARFEIGNVTSGKGVKNVKIEGVWINNFPAAYTGASTVYESTSEYWKITPAASTASATKLIPTNIPAYTPDFYFNKYNEKVDGTEMVYAYTLFAGNYVPRLIMLVSGEFEPSINYDGNNYFLGWLTYSTFTDDNEAVAIDSVDPNIIYKVGLKGIVVNAEDITTNPELKQHDMGIVIERTPWTEVHVTPSVN